MQHRYVRIHEHIVAHMAYELQYRYDVRHTVFDVDRTPYDIRHTGFDENCTVSEVHTTTAVYTVRKERTVCTTYGFCQKVRRTQSLTDTARTPSGAVALARPALDRRHGRGHIWNTC
jgi:hypothetical protein